MAYVIFDLDGTVINSNHRKVTLPDGSLDLAHWFKNNTPEKIRMDTLLPLAKVMQNVRRAGHTTIICTARMFDVADLNFVWDNGLFYDALLYREFGNMESDETLKARLITEYFVKHGFKSVADARPIMFDDNLKVINAMTSLGIKCYDATRINERLAA